MVVLVQNVLRDTRVGCYQSNLAPFNRTPLLWFCCAFCSDVSLQLQKGSNTISHLKRCPNVSPARQHHRRLAESLVSSLGSVRKQQQQPQRQQHRARLRLAGELASYFPDSGSVCRAAARSLLDGRHRGCARISGTMSCGAGEGGGRSEASPPLLTPRGPGLLSVYG